MLKQSSKLIQGRIKNLLENVGDLALKRRARRILEEIDLNQGEKVLEIGCGNGYYLNLFNKTRIKLDLYGVDIDERALIDAKRYLGREAKLIRADAADLPFPNKSFDKVIMSEVIEHVRDEKKVLSEAYRVLKNNGILILTTCSIDYPFLWDPVNWVLHHFFKTHIKSGFWAGIWNQHLRLYKINDLNELVEKSKFRIETSELLTRWCLPFNHYMVNFIARLFYQGSLPKGISAGLNKFKREKGSILVRFIFWFINTYDYLNDLFPSKNGVSIFVKARK